MPAWEIENEADLKRLVQIGVTPESLYLDFKSALDRGPAAQHETGRDIAQFANTHGGVLLIGVKEARDPLTKIKTASEICGVQDPDQCRADIEQWTRNVLLPSDFTKTIAFISTQSTLTPTQQVVVVAVNIPASRRLIWVAPKGEPGIEAVRRTNHGKDYMRPNEIERHWSNTARAAQIAFQDALVELRSSSSSGSPIDVEIVGGVLTLNANLRRKQQYALNHSPSIASEDARGFDLRVPIGGKVIVLRVPFELLDTAWVDNRRLHILPRAQIVFDPVAVALRFDPFDRPM